MEQNQLIYFENRFVANDSMLREYITKIVTKKGGIVTLVFCAVLLLLYPVFFIVQDMFYIVLLPILILFFGFLYILTIWLLIKRVKDISQALHGTKEPLETVVRFGEQICLSEGTKQSMFEYHQITSVHTLKRVWVLMIGKYNAILLEPNSFSYGDPKAFFEYLRRKCPNIR